MKKGLVAPDFVVYILLSGNQPLGTVRVRLKKRNSLSQKIAPIGLVLMLSGCEMPSNLMELIPAFPSFPALPLVTSFIPEFDLDECAVVSPKALKRVNWSRVPEVNMRIRNDEFEPMIVQMTQGWPYTFRISNRDDRAHTFHARDFFANIAMVRVTVDGERQDDICFPSIEIPAQSTAEMQLVAAVDGHFDFRDDWLPAASLISGGADGVIVIEERRKARRD